MLRIEVTGLDGKQIEVNIDPYKRVVDLKLELEKMSSIPSLEQTLVQAGRVLEDDICLGSLGSRVIMVREDMKEGMTVELHSLRAVQFNGCRGQVIGAQDGRIQVKFPDGSGKAFKPANVKRLREDDSFPRWIDDATVDSPAMLSAFFQFIGKPHSENERQMRSRNLVVVNHKRPDEDSAMYPGVLTDVPCKNKGCERCEGQRGGYQFRWYDPRWKDDYLRLRRPGAWEPVTP